MSNGAHRRGDLAGRSGLLAHIDALLEGAIGGKAAAVCVEGQAGSGKTALCGAAAERAVSRGFRCIRATAVEGEADLPLAGLSMMLRPLRRDIETAALSSDQRAALAAAAGAGGAPVTDRFTLGAAMLALLGAVAEARPLLIIVDDVQWLDQATSDAMSFAIRRLDADAVAVLLAARTGEAASVVWPEARRIAVAGLDTTAVAVLLREMGLAVAENVADEIQNATGGLPLAILETARMLTADQLTGSEPLPDPLPVGTAVVEQYRRKLNAIPAATRRVVVVVALAGSIGTERVETALRDLGLDPVELLSAESAQILMMSPEGFVPAHPLLRTAALTMTPHSELRTVHRALAAASRSDPERYARHLEGAAEGPDERVAAALLAAAADVSRRVGPAAAAPLLNRAATFTRPGELRLERQLGAARALGLAGRAADAAGLAKEVLVGTNDPGRATDAALVMVDAAFWGSAADDQYALAVDAAERIVAVDRERAVRALGRACIAAAAQGSLATAARLGERAVSLLDASSPSWIRAEAEQATVTALVLTGGHERARSLMARWTTPSVQDVTAGGMSGVRWPTTVQTLVRLGRLAEAGELVRVLLDVYRREAAPSAVPYVLQAATELWWWSGDWPRAVTAGQEAAALAEQTGQPVLAGFAQAATGRVLAAQGDERRCRSHLDAALTEARDVGSPVLRAFALAALGLLELGKGSAASAVVALVEAEDIRRSAGCRDAAVVPSGADLVEALMRSDNAPEARAALDEHEAIAEASGSAWAAATALRCHGLLADRVDDQEAAFVAAVERHPTDMPFELARTQLVWGEQRRRRRDIIGSRSVLEAALSTFERLGARPWADRAAAELRAAGRRRTSSRESAASAPTVLTPQELRCALAVADGRTNREAAASLFVSPKTIEYHLGKVFAKLGVRSRTELARILTLAPPTVQAEDLTADDGALRAAAHSAEGVAAVRAVAALRHGGKALGIDHLATAMLSPPVRRRLPSAEQLEAALPGLLATEMARTAFFDRYLIDEIRSGIDQIVVLAAGFDTRPHRFPDEVRGTSVYVVDRAPMLQARANRLRAAALLSADVLAVAADLAAGSPAHQLLDAGLDPYRRVAVLCCGISMYLPSSAFAELLSWVAGMQRGSSIAVDYVARSVVEGDNRPHGAAAVRARLAAAGEIQVLGFGVGELAAVARAVGLVQERHLGPAEITEQLRAERSCGIPLGYHSLALLRRG